MRSLGNGASLFSEGNINKSLNIQSPTSIKCSNVKLNAHSEDGPKGQNCICSLSPPTCSRSYLIYSHIGLPITIPITFIAHNVQYPSNDLRTFPHTFSKACLLAYCTIFAFRSGFISPGAFSEYLLLYYFHSRILAEIYSPPCIQSMLLLTSVAAVCFNTSANETTRASVSQTENEEHSLNDHLWKILFKELYSKG